MIIPDFSIPSKDCFLTVDKNGTKIKVGDVLTSNNIPLRGTTKQEQEYNPVTEFEGKLVIKIKPSHMVAWFARAHCVIKK